MKIKDLFSNVVPRQIISRYYWKVPLLVQNLHFIVKHSFEGYLKWWLMYFAFLNYENQPKLKSLIVNFALHDLMFRVFILISGINWLQNDPLELSICQNLPPDLSEQFCLEILLLHNLVTIIINVATCMFCFEYCKMHM